MVELQNNSPVRRTGWMLTSLLNTKQRKSFQNLACSVMDLQRYPLAIYLNVLVVSVFNSWVIDSPLSYVTSFFLTNQSKASITLIANRYHFWIIANFICTSNLKVSPSMYLTIKSFVKWPIWYETNVLIYIKYKIKAFYNYLLKQITYQKYRLPPPWWPPTYFPQENCAIFSIFDWNFGITITHLAD